MSYKFNYFVLDFNQPSWSGELEDCGVLKGTNTLVKHGFTVTYSDSKQVNPNCKDASVSTMSMKVITILLDKTMHLKPHHSKVIQTVLEDKMVMRAEDFMISHNETILTERFVMCLKQWRAGILTRLLFH